MSRTVCLVGVGFIVLLVGFLAGGAATPRAAADEGQEQVEIVLPEPLALEDFLRLVQRRLDVPLVWDPKSRALQNKELTPDLAFRGTKDEVLDAIRGLLTAYELVLVPVGQGANRKYFVADARQTQSLLRLKPAYVELGPDNLEHYATQDGLFVTTTIAMENVENLRDARNALSRLVTGQGIGSVQEVPDARAVVVTDFAPNVVAIYRLLKQMDVPVAARGPDTKDREVVFRAVPIRHAEAADVARLLQKHFALEASTQPRRAVAPNQAVPTVPPVPPLRIDADLRLNQVLVTGMQKDVVRVVEVVAALDRPRPAAPLVIEVIELAHIQAGPAAATLQALIHRSPSAWLAEEGVRDLPVVEAHTERNALLIQAGSAAAETLRRVIREMDVARNAAPAEESGDAE
jgi:type II secretory pathway component GspD/PulD (secretin)